jgi:L-asparaginase II
MPIALSSREITPGAREAIGSANGGSQRRVGNGAVKVADGSGRCRDGVVLDLLRATGSLSGDEMARLEEYRAPVRRNVVGREVGRVVPDLALERCE